jgi:hypothetical protein
MNPDNPLFPLRILRRIYRRFAEGKALEALSIEEIAGLRRRLFIYTNFIPGIVPLWLIALLPSYIIRINRKAGS